MNKACVVLAVVVVLFSALLLSASGCGPKTAGFFGDKPVDRETFERQAVKRRGDLELERVVLTARLESLRKLGDDEAIAKLEVDLAAHEAASKTFNELYGNGAADLERQSEANREMFSALTAIGEIGGEAVGIPPGVTQVALGALLAFGGRAGWIRLKRPPQSPPNGRSPTPPTTDPPVSA